MIDVELEARENADVSLAEIETAIERLSEDERLRLYEYLGRRLSISDERRARWSEIMREMDEGKKFTSAQVEEMIRDLEAQGL